MSDIRFTEVQTTKFTEVKGSPKELYGLLVKEKRFTGSYEQFLYKYGLQVTKSPALAFRFHVITDSGEHIRFEVKALKFAEEIRDNLGDSAEKDMLDEKSWRQFRKSFRRKMRRFG